ncbi:hypothetical protein GCM10009809_40740 [Isoptericola hypogeus]|uniref:Tryptophan-associated transmembrane protein (Trp_oprn_chp) n=1 Tax=Isoptericola hypogeus TaxID=300179 RepID=A0ABP4W0E5_9MICO
MSDPQRSDGPPEPTVRPVSIPPSGPAQPPGTVPTGEPAESWDAPAPSSADRLRFDVRRYWAGAVVTVVVCGLVGLAASVIFDQAFDVGLLGPFGGSTAAWTLTGALFGLVSAAVLQLLVLVAPRPRMFFGWLVGVVTLILAVAPFTGDPEPIPALMTALVWILLGVATSSMLSGVLGRTLVRPARPATR